MLNVEDQIAKLEEKDVAKEQAGRKMFEALVGAEDQIIWMSGSSDFSPGGVAHAGWVKTNGIIDTVREALAAGREAGWGQ